MVNHGFSDFDPLNTVVKSTGSAGKISRNVPLSMAVLNEGKVGDTFALDTEFRTAIQEVVRGLVRSRNKIASILETKNGKIPLGVIKDSELGESFLDMSSSIYPEYSSNKAALNAYMLRTSACYVEIPGVKKDYNTGIVTPHKTKFIATTNIDIAREWAGEENLKKSHYAKLSNIDTIIDEEVNEETGTTVPYLKLEHDRDGNPKIVSPRKSIELENLIITPLFVYKEIVDYIYEISKDCIVRVKYLRTSGEDRTMDITFNEDKLAEVYGQEYSQHILEVSYKGSFDNETYLHRGFVKVPSIGESKFDGVTRSLNFATIYSIELDVDTDLTFVNVELNKVIGEFVYGAKKLISTNFSEYMSLSDVLKEEGVIEYSLPTDPEDLDEFLNRREILEGSTFKKKLASFMMVAPQWFPEFGIRSDDSTEKPEARSLGLL